MTGLHHLSISLLLLSQKSQHGVRDLGQLPGRRVGGRRRVGRDRRLRVATRRRCLGRGSDVADRRADPRRDLEGVRAIRDINRHVKAFSDEVQPGRAREEGSLELTDWIKREAWGHHACGTCRIGKDPWRANVKDLEDQMAVIDSAFRVHGVRGLSVTDALERVGGLSVGQQYEVARAVDAGVLELVEGDTLAERCRSGPMTLEQSLKNALQIAEALEAAHERGVIHRDLKPANIKVTPEGRLKVLDFGIAKALPFAASRSVQDAPLTKLGAVIGTAPYMSPEQTRGEAVGRQTDIWSFGVVLYEMLTGYSPFERPSAPETVARVLEAQPEFDDLPKATPQTVRHLLRRCLEKDQKRRLQHIGDARIEIEDALAALAAGPAPDPADSAASAASTGSPRTSARSRSTVSTPPTPRSAPTSSGSWTRGTRSPRSSRSSSPSGCRRRRAI